MKPLAIMTMVRNEPYFLPRWLEYYGRVPDVSLYVLDHESDDGSTRDIEDIDTTRVVVHHEEAERATWMLATVQDHMRHLFATGYKRVIYAEVDEFLVPDLGRWPSLAEFLDANPGRFVASQGWHVVYRPGDPPLPETGSMVAGRKWKRESFYDMTLVCSEVPRWKLGRHGLEDRENGPDVGLRLVHLHYADPELGWKRIQDRTRGKAPATDGCGYQNKYRDRAEFDAHWAMMCGDDRDGPAVPVPDEYARVI